MPVVFHVGLTKCASTTLQEYFQLHPDLGVPDRRETLKHFVTQGCFDFDPAAAASFLRQADPDGGAMVLSHERLAGSPHSGMYDAKEIVDRIRKVCPEARLILCIREQYDLIVSCYKQFVRIGGALRFREYVQAPWQFRIPRFNPRAFEYDRLITYYRSLFGEANVLVLLLEQLREESAEFYVGLNRFLGVETAAGFDLAQRRHATPETEDVVSRRIENYLSGKRFNVIEQPPFETDEALAGAIRAQAAGQPRRSSEEYREAARSLLPDVYRESNRRTNRLLDGALTAFHYEL